MAELVFRSGDSPRDEITVQVLLGNDVLAEHTNRTGVPVGLRRPPDPLSLARDRGEHRSGSRVGAAVGEVVSRSGNRAERRRRLLVDPAPAPGRADAEAVEPLIAERPERVHEHAADDILAVVGIDILGAAIAHAVEAADLIGEEAVRELAVHHSAQIAARDEQGREPALDEHRRRRGLQPLEPERRLELPGLDLELRQVAEVHVGIEECGRAVGKVGHDAEVDELEDRALDERAHAAKHERVVADILTFREPARVELRVAAQLDRELSVRGAQEEAVGARARGRRAAGLLQRVLVLHLELSLEDLDLLLDLAQPLAVGVCGIGSAGLGVGSPGGPREEEDETGSDPADLNEEHESSERAAPAHEQAPCLPPKPE